MLGEPIAGHGDAFGDGLADSATLSVFGFDIGQCCGHPLMPGDRPGQGGGRVAHTVGREVGAGTHAYGYHDGPGRRRHLEDLTR